jgi:hypothetical protein
MNTEIFIRDIRMIREIRVMAFVYRLTHAWTY